MGDSGRVVAEVEIDGIGKVSCGAAWVAADDGTVYLGNMHINALDLPPIAKRRALTESDEQTMRDALTSRVLAYFAMPGYSLGIEVAS